MHVDPAKACVRKINVHKKILRTRNCRRRFVKHLLHEQRKEDM